MRNSKYKLLIIVLVFLFFMIIPFIQSFIFSSNTDGRIEVNKEVEFNYTNSDKKFLLIFFGYVGCKDVCTPILYALNDLYESKEFEQVKDDVDVLFINLTPEVEQSQPDLFAKFFNKDFKGVYLFKGDLFRMDRSFKLSFARSLSDKIELNHTDNVYLIQNNPSSKVLKYMYSSHPLNTKKLINDIMYAKMQKIEGTE